MRVAPHPLLDLAAFVTTFPAPLGELTTPPALATWLGPNTPEAPALAGDDELKTAVRAMLRHDGFRPAGRNKPASEYLVSAAAAGRLRGINLAVDACNAASHAHGLPISVVDYDAVDAPLAVAVAAEGASYVFNPSGQTIDVGGLLCLHDAEGPCANAVKDSQRTKTGEATTRTLSLIWGIAADAGRTAALEAWYRARLEEAGARTERVQLEH